MIRSPRIRTASLLGLMALALAPDTASAQFVSGIGIRNPLGGFPFQNPYFSYQRSAARSWTFQTPWGGTVSASRWYSGSTTGYNNFYHRLPYSYYATYRKYIPSSSYSGADGGPGFRAPAANQAMIGNAQAAAERNAMAIDGRRQVFDQWAYEKVGVKGLKDPALTTGAPELRRALAPEAEGEAATGEPLNTILVAALALEKNGAKAPGNFLPPELLEQVRFARSPAAEALNTLRSAGKLPFPSVFDSDRMFSLRDEIQADFQQVAETAGTGKAIDQNRVARLMDVVQRARDRLAPIARDLPFEDAIAARRFLNDLDQVARVLRDGANAGLLNPRWNTEGTTVPDLVKHMAKYKLLFAPAPKDGAEAYLALHRNLANYHAALNQPMVKK